MFFSCEGEFLIGLFYEVSSNVNPYAVKTWSTNDFSLRPNQNPIKCSIAIVSEFSPILYMAGKQKYGRGISLGLLDIESSTVIRELKSDPDTSIGDEIRRIIRTDQEKFIIVACTEHTTTFTCFVIFKLEDFENQNNSSNHLKNSITNCTMILTRFDCDPNFTFPLKYFDNVSEQFMLTVLRNHQILIWQLNDGEIRSTHDFRYLNSQENLPSIIQCQMQEQRLFILLENHIVQIWNIQTTIDQTSLVTTIVDSSVRVENRNSHSLGSDTDS